MVKAGYGGDEKRGFEASVDAQRGLLHVRMWGLWDDTVIEAYEQSLEPLFARLNGGPWAAITDRRLSPAQRPEVSDRIRAVIYRGVAFGCAHIAVITEASSTKLQHWRLMQQAGLTSVSFHEDDADALAAALDALPSRT